MKQILLAEKISNINEDILTLMKHLRAAELTDILRFPETYEKLTSDASIISERISCSIRHVLYNMPNAKKSEVMDKVADAQGIEIELNEKWMQITLPILLQRKKHKNAEFVSDPLFYALSKFTLEHECPPLEQTMVCFKHIYDRNMPERNLRDYDNIEEKQVLDVIALFTMVDDNGRLCDVFNTTSRGDTDCTQIFVMSPDYFLPWLGEHGID